MQPCRNVPLIMFCIVKHVPDLIQAVLE